MYHWLQTLNTLGINDASVTADYPFVGVFTKNGKKSYAAYNFATQPLTIKASNPSSRTMAAIDGVSQPEKVITEGAFATFSSTR